MTEAEEDARHKWYREVETPLHEKIKKYNISVIEKKTFSKNPTEQVEEKRKYIEDVISKMSYNEASYYDGLVEFEKYGKREALGSRRGTTLCELTINFPKNNPTEKTVNKFMDVFDKHSIYRVGYDADGLTCELDGQEFVTIITEKGVLKTESQVERALGICKKLIWNDDHVRDLYYALVKDTNAQFHGNKKIEAMIKNLHESAKSLRAQFKGDINLQYYEAWLAEHPISY